MTRDCIEISRYEEDDEDDETFWLSSQSIVFGYGIIDVNSRVAKKVKSDKLLVVEDHEEGGHILVTSTIQGVCHGASWDTPGQIGLVEALPLIVPSPDELKLLKQLGPRHKDAAWVAIVVEEPHEEHRVGNCGNNTRFNVAVGGLSKPEVELARLCDDLRSFEPSLMSKSVACALAHAADAELNGLGLPHGARGEALRLLPGAPKSFFGKPYDQVLMDADFHRLVENLDEFNDWFGTKHTPEDIEVISKTLINEHGRRHNLRHAHKFVKEKKCEPTADAIIEKLNFWYWCRTDADKEVVRNNMDAILAPEADPDWFIGADDDDVEKMGERSLELKCPTRRALVDGAFCQAATRAATKEKAATVIQSKRRGFLARCGLAKKREARRESSLAQGDEQQLESLMTGYYAT